MFCTNNRYLLVRHKFTDIPNKRLSFCQFSWCFNVNWMLFYEYSNFKSSETLTDSPPGLDNTCCYYYYNYSNEISRTISKIARERQRKIRPDEQKNSFTTSWTLHALRTRWALDEPGRSICHWPSSSRVNVHVFSPGRFFIFFFNFVIHSFIKVFAPPPSPRLPTRHSVSRCACVRV